ncbi:hypothetical protein [Phenylobacterium sp. J367]|uniref:hypothetical protein n=1 Tax=Phenylobacterium sp. J367 TaxID=2898435 RepID=UPI002150AD5F|nr:hypothetical protein [Phenylobacterium sp. J367]MCR5879216.1 hypothetical protein [Phenylobacterium sp. J367]
MIAITFAAVLMMADTTAQAAQPAPVAEQPAKKGKVNKNGLVCKKEAVLGSKLPTKVCMTQEQWDERRMIDRQNTEQQQRFNPQPVG